MKHVIENKLANYFVSGSYSFMKPEIVAKHRRNFPLMLNIEPTLACNLSCYMCPSHNKDAKTLGIRKSGFMSWELYTKIIDECAAEGPILVLNMHKDGESMLHPQFLDMISYAKNKNATQLVHFNTNATFKNLDVVDKVLDSGVDDITMSIDAFYPESYFKVKGKDLLHIVNRNVKHFFTRRAERGLTKPYIRVKMLGTPENKEEFILFKDYWKDIADETQCQMIHNFAGGLKFNREAQLERYACEFPFYSTAINWDGTVTLCHRDYNNRDIFGNVTHETLKSIYNGRKYRQYMEALINGNEQILPICQNCDNWKDGPDLGKSLTQKLLLETQTEYETT